MKIKLVFFLFIWFKIAYSQNSNLFEERKIITPEYLALKYREFMPVNNIELNFYPNDSIAITYFIFLLDSGYYIKKFENSKAIYPMKIIKCPKHLEVEINTFYLFALKMAKKKVTANSYFPELLCKKKYYCFWVNSKDWHYSMRAKYQYRDLKHINLMTNIKERRRVSRLIKKIETLNFEILK